MVERRVRKGDELFLEYVGRTGCALSTLAGYAEVLYDDGTHEWLFLDSKDSGLTFDYTFRTISKPVIFAKDGTVRDAYLQGNWNTVDRGEAYVYLAVRGSSFRDLCRGYAFEGCDIHLGSFERPGPSDGRGFLRTVTGANPAAGAEVLETVPAGVWWRLIAFSAVLVASAAVANRVPRLVGDRGAATARSFFIQDDGTNPITAGQTRTAQWTRGNPGPGLPGGAINADTQTGRFIEGLPDIDWLQPGDRIRTVTAAIDVADDYAAPIYVVEEWVMP